MLTSFQNYRRHILYICTAVYVHTPYPEQIMWGSAVSNLTRIRAPRFYGHITEQIFHTAGVLCAAYAVRVFPLNSVETNRTGAVTMMATESCPASPIRAPPGGVLNAVPCILCECQCSPELQLNHVVEHRNSLLAACAGGKRDSANGGGEGGPGEGSACVLYQEDGGIATLTLNRPKVCHTAESVGHVGQQQFV